MILYRIFAKTKRFYFCQLIWKMGNCSTSIYSMDCILSFGFFFFHIPYKYLLSSQHKS